MSDNPDARPWDNHPSPMEALYQWFKGEIGLLKGEAPPATPDAEAPVVADDPSAPAAGPIAPEDGGA
jgi:hypothetical protein